jgi:histidyl-tRNA synthetase
MIQALRGMKDILPPESSLWDKLQRLASSVFSSFGYQLVITPIVEKTELFARSVGEGTDVVSKEMYVFTDRGGESICLRPEGTASIMRAYLNDPEAKSRPLKAWYWGPMFRYERPQKGRYRQFHQFGIEAIGSSSPYVDAELIYMLDVFYKELGINDVRVELNSIGCELCRPSYKDYLVKYLGSNEDKLCNDCKNRINTNPLRVLDCKVDNCSKIINGAPLIQDFLCVECNSHNDVVLSVLDSCGVKYSKNPLLVRGLDYYSRTVFEFVSDNLGGRQNALGGGGRYDDLSTQIGGQKIPSVGYAGGVERTVLFMPESDSKKTMVYVAALDQGSLNSLAPIIYECKKLCIDKKVLFIDDDFKARDIKKHLSRADKLGAKFALIVGTNELNSSSLIIKDLVEKKESKIDVKYNDVGSTAKIIVGRMLEEKNS